MILESKLEEKALDLICTFASEYLDRHGCTDLTEEEQKLFEKILIPCQDHVGDVQLRQITQQGEVLEWFKTRIIKLL